MTIVSLGNKNEAQRYVQSLPRPSPSGLKVTPISLLPPRASSFHRKSGSTGGLTASTPLKQHKISLDNIPRATVTPIQPVPSEKKPAKFVAPQLKDISLSSDSDSDVIDCTKSKLEISSEEEKTPPKPRSNSTTPQPRPVTVRKHLPRRSRTIGGETDKIRPGKVAEILHRFSSTNRGAIRSVYYDSNSDSESSSAIWLRSDEDDEDVDHLSRLLDQTLDDLGDEDYDTE